MNVSHQQNWKNQFKFSYKSVRVITMSSILMYCLCNKSFQSGCVKWITNPQTRGENKNRFDCVDFSK